MKIGPLFISIVLIVLCHHGKAQKKSTVFVELTTINSSSDDFSPIFCDSTTLLFTSSKINPLSEKVMANSHNIYSSIFNENEWSSPKRLNYSTNSDNHESSLGMSEDNNTMYVYKTFNGGDVYFTTKTSNNLWSPLKRMKFNTQYHESSACECANIVYFVSDKPLGKGKHDIYSSQLIDGQWSKAINVTILNSENDENHIYIAKDCKTIYFSSKGHGSTGGYDIFKSYKEENGQWSSPKNLGSSINSPYNEINFTKDLNSNSYFASDRPSILNKGYNIYSNSQYIKVLKDRLAIVDSLATADSSAIVVKKTDYRSLENLTIEEVKAAIDFDIENCKIQVGAFSYINSLSEFHENFPLLKGKVDMIVEEEYNRFLLKESVLTLEEAVEIQRKCIMEYESVNDTFIGIYDKNNLRVMIYFSYNSRYRLRHKMKKM